MQHIKIDKTNWQKVILGDVVFEPKETAKNIVAEHFAHIVGLEHIDSNDIHLRTSFSAKTETTFTKIFRQGDVLFGRRRAYLKKAAQANFNGVCSGDITVLRSNENLEKSLLPFIIHNDRFFDHAIKHSAGGLSPRVKFKDLASYEFLLPPKAQQIEIAELLWATNELIEKDSVLLKKLENMKISKLDEFYTSGSSYCLKDLILNSFTGSTPNTKDLSFYSNGTIEWITTKEILSNETFSGEKLINVKAITSSGLKILPKENIIVGIRVGVGKFSINRVDISFSQDVLGLEIDKSKVDVNYLINILNGFSFQSQLTKHLRGTTIKGILKEDILNIKFKLPTLQIQKENQKYFQKINDCNFQLKAKLASSKALHKSLINQLF